MFRQQRILILPKRLLFPALILIIAVVVFRLGIGSWRRLNRAPSLCIPIGSPCTAHPSPVITSGIPPINNGSVSPLIFGTNLSLFDSNDQVLTSADTRNALQQMHFRIIRMPVRSSLSNATEIQAAQAIKTIGAYALVVLRGAVDANVLADDTRLVNDMNNVFGNTPVFYEYGNEEDLLGVNVTRYTASWNSIVPQLKRIAHNAYFIGPVNYRYDRTYLTTFLQHASPRPDEVSWHEYSCDDSWPNDTCISRLANWTNHINDARSAMTQAIGTAL